MKKKEQRVRGSLYTYSIHILICTNQYTYWFRKRSEAYKEAKISWQKCLSVDEYVYFQNSPPGPWKLYDSTYPSRNAPMSGSTVITKTKGDQSWVFFGRNDAKAETPVLWPPHAKSWLIGKHSDAGRDWGQEEKGTTEDEMAGWHHGLNGRESEWTPGVGDGQGGLANCNSWSHKESDTTERLNWTELNMY